MDHYKEYPRQGSHGVVTGADRVVTPTGGGGVLLLVCARQRVWFFSRFGINFDHFWSGIGYDLCTLVLNWVCFLEEATSPSLVLYAT